MTGYIVKDCNQERNTSIHWYSQL